MAALPAQIVAAEGTDRAWTGARPKLSPQAARHLAKVMGTDAPDTMPPMPQIPADLLHQLGKMVENSGKILQTVEALNKRMDVIEGKVKPVVAAPVAAVVAEPAAVAAIAKPAKADQDAVAKKLKAALASAKPAPKADDPSDEDDDLPPAEK